MIAIVAAISYFAISAIVIWASIYINKNIGLDESTSKRSRFKDAGVSLRPTRVKRGPGHLARGFLSFREEHDMAWEVAEASMIAAVFVLLFLGFEEEEYVVSLISHVLVGVLLALKFASLGAFWWVQHHSQEGHGLD
jgi:sugar phosphate permease